MVWVLAEITRRLSQTGSRPSVTEMLLVTSVAKWRVCLSTQEARVRSLVWEDPTCLRARQPTCPNPSLEPELLPPSPGVSVCPSSVPLCAVTAPEEPPLILCSNNGAPPTPDHPRTTRILKSIGFNEISIPVSVVLLCFVWVLQGNMSQGWDKTSCQAFGGGVPGRRNARGCESQDWTPRTW